jgi:hypothetical protein
MFITDKLYRDNVSRRGLPIIGARCIIFLVDSPSHNLTKNSNLQYVYHIIFINFVESWQKTCDLFYRRFVHLGIVGIDGWQESPTIHQTPSPWWAIRCSSGMVLIAELALPTVASAEGADQGRCCGDLLNSTDWPRKKLITKLYNLF